MDSSYLMSVPAATVDHTVLEVLIFLATILAGSSQAPSFPLQLTCTSWSSLDLSSVPLWAHFSQLPGGFIEAKLPLASVTTSGLN